MMFGDQTIGTCSICGGAVVCPRVVWSVVPPVPTCSRCGATAASHGPVIPMQPARRQPGDTDGVEWMRRLTVTNGTTSSRITINSVEVESNDGGAQ